MVSLHLPSSLLVLSNHSHGANAGDGKLFFQDTHGLKSSPTLFTTCNLIFKKGYNRISKRHFIPQKA